MSNSEDSSSEEEYDGVYYHTRLIKLIEETITLSSTYLAKGDKGGKVLLKYIGAYKAIMKGATYDFDLDHAPIFSKMFSDDRQRFMHICANDDFLVDKKKPLQAWYGVSDVKEKAKNRRLPLSVCIGYAKEMREIKSKELTDDPEEDAAVMQTVEYIMYGELKYFLMRVIWCSVDEIYKKSLETILEELRYDTSLEDDDEDVPGTSMSSVVGSIASALGARKGKLGDTLKGVAAVMEDGQFMNSVESVTKEVGSMSHASMGDCMKTVFDRISPEVTSLVERNGVKPPGVVSSPPPRDDKAMGQMKEGIQKIIGELS